MKIGFDAKRLYNNFTGLGNHSRTTIDILTTEFPEHEYYLYTPKTRLNRVTEPYLTKEGCHTVQPCGIMKGGAWRTFGLASAMKADGVQLFHGLSNEIPVGLRRAGIPSVVTIHDVAFNTFPDMYYWHDRQIYDLKWKYACRNADRIIAISECTKRDIMRFYDVPDDRIDVVYQPVAPRYYIADASAGNDADTADGATAPQAQPSLPELVGRDYMLYVGSVNSRKNLLGIVKAMEMMPRDLDLPLVIVGDGGAYKQKVQEYITRHGMDDRFLWPKNVSQDTLMSLYRSARLFVYPSFYEGFGLPVVEAQLCGCPVVTSNVSSLPEAGGPFALKADPTEPADISAQMVKILTDTDLRISLAAQGRDYALRTFHPSVLARELMATYSKVLSD